MQQECLDQLKVDNTFAARSEMNWLSVLASHVRLALETGVRDKSAIHVWRDWERLGVWETDGVFHLGRAFVTV